jgi:hypothetical protein
VPRLPQLVLPVFLALLCTLPTLDPSAARAAGDDEPWIIRASREKSRLTPPQTLRFAAIKPGRTMRVESGEDVVEGPFQRFVADTLWLGSTAGVEGVPFAADSIRTVWTRGSAAGKGALIGGLVGGVLLIAAAGALVSDTSDISEVNESGFITAGALGFAGGAVLGALVGSTRPGWHQKYP